MSACVRAPELEAALDGRLDADATRQVFAHARGCARCREARAELEGLRDLARAMPDVSPDAVYARRVRGAIMGEALLGRPARPPMQRFALMAAACVALLLGVGAWVKVRHASSAPVASTVDARRVDLAGAGSLWPALDARVLVRSAGPLTRIELWQGEIVMQVNRRAPGERFVVVLSDAEVEVHSTRFTVVADAGRLTRVDVAEGVVAVRHAGDPERFLTAGTHLVLPVSPPTDLAVDGAADEDRATASATPAPTPVRTQPAVDPGVWFREGSLAYARGDHALADRALGRFLSTAPRSDPRREDARYLRVLSLHALARVDALVREADAYAREFPGGLRRPEVVLAVVSSLAGDGRCEEASEAARALPDGASARIRGAVSRALRCESDAGR